MLRTQYVLYLFGCDLRELIIQRISWTQNLVVVAFCCYLLFAVNRQSLHRKCLDELLLHCLCFCFSLSEHHQFFFARCIDDMSQIIKLGEKKHILIYSNKNWEWTSFFIRFVFVFNFQRKFFYSEKLVFDVLHLVNWCHFSNVTIGMWKSIKSW